MNFSINREVLLENLTQVSRALPVKTAMPVLNGIKFYLEGKNLLLTASNADISVQVQITDESLEIKEEGNIVVPGKKLIEIIRKIDSRIVNISVIEKTLVVIKAERFEGQIQLFEANDYPNIDFVNLDKPLALDANLLKQIVRETSYAASTSEKRPILSGVNLSYKDEKFTAIATDSFRLSQKLIYVHNLYEDFNIVVPNKSLDELGKALENYKDNVDIYFAKTKILFKFKNLLFQSRLLDGNYPDTSRLIPETFPIHCKFNKEDLINAIERVSILSAKDKDNNYNIVRFRIREDQVCEISSTNQEIGYATEEVLTTEPIHGTELKIAFSSKYILDALRSFVSPQVSLSFTGEIRPFIIQGEQDLNLTHLILPIKIDW